MIGIGVGIDYALLILTRFRTGLAAGSTRARRRRSGHARRARVLFAGTTVVISLLGLFVVGLPYLYGVALSAIVAVLVVMAASVTLLPRCSGSPARGSRLRVPFTGPPRGRSGHAPAARWSRAVQRRPWPAAIAGAAVLLVLASPFAGLRLGFPDRGNDPADTTTRAAYDLVSHGFGPGRQRPAPARRRAPRRATATPSPRWPAGCGRARRRRGRPARVRARPATPR